MITSVDLKFFPTINDDFHNIYTQHVFPLLGHRAEQNREQNRTEPILSFQVTKFFSLSFSLFFFTFLINQTLNSSQQTNSLSLNMNGHFEDNSYCYFHPKEVVVGVCSLCLTEKLLILAAKKGHHVSSASGRASAHRTPSGMHKKPPISLPKIFAFSSFFNRQWKPNYLDQEASTSQEGNFFLWVSGKVLVFLVLFFVLQLLVIMRY